MDRPAHGDTGLLAHGGAGRPAHWGTGGAKSLNTEQKNASEDTGRCTGAVGTGESARMPDGAHDHPSPPILPMPDE